ncbi:MAG TPA: TetR/AcrR family transcriptional regulator [Xanthobacteraceae bacterium]|jgi:AcrR family transcriptional regulator
MPYPAGHRDATRTKIVAAARSLFNRFGFDGVSIDQIMSAAGLTHGGFYRHFAGKSDLYAASLACFFTDPSWKNNWKGVKIEPTAADIGAQIVRAYLSRQHFEDIANSCPMVALPSDVARSGKRAKAAYEAVFKAMVEFLQRGASGTETPNRTVALSIAALCAGGMIIARASDDRNFADEVRDACMTVALRLGGWDQTELAHVAAESNTAQRGKRRRARKAAAYSRQAVANLRSKRPITAVVKAP